MKYSVLIRWSEEDQCFLVFLPELQNIMQPVTHGDTYKQAIENAEEVIALLAEEVSVPKFGVPERTEPFFQAA